MRYDSIRSREEKEYKKKKRRTRTDLISGQTAEVGT